jgi:hypothetical protein
MYNHTNSLNNLQKAIVSAKEVVAATPVVHPNRAEPLQCLAGMLSLSYENRRTPEVLERMVLVKDEVIAAMSLGHPERALYLYDLGRILVDKYNCTGILEDLQQAISKTQGAVVATSTNDANHSLF